MRRLRLLVVGAGDVGRRLVAQLAGRFADRIALIATSRDQEQRQRLRALGARTLAIDLDSRASARRVGGFGRWVVDLAPPAPAGSKDPRSNALIAAFQRNDARLSRRVFRLPDGRSRPAIAIGGSAWVYVSTTGVYGDSRGAQFDETRPVNPQSERAQRRVAAESAWRRAGRSIVAAAPTRVVILRVPGIYADDRLPLDRLRRALPALPTDEDVYTNHIHADDLARIAWTGLLRGRANRVYHTVDDSDLKMGDYFDLVADALGLPRPPRLPREQLRAAVSPAMWSFMRESRRLLNRRLRNELRVRLRFPHVRDALAGLASR